MIFYALFLRGSTSAGSAEGASTSAAVGETVEDDRANALASDLGGRSVGGRRAAEMSWKSGDMGIHIYNCNIYIYIIGYEYDLIK